MQMEDNFMRRGSADLWWSVASCTKRRYSIAILNTFMELFYEQEYCITAGRETFAQY